VKRDGSHNADGSFSSPAASRNTRASGIRSASSKRGSQTKIQQCRSVRYPSSELGRGIIRAINVGMSDLAHIFQEALLDRPVVDRTGISGKFDFTLRWTPSEFEHGQRPPEQRRPDDPPPFFEAIQEQLGLKLQSARSTVEVIVIDRVDRPSSN
jgi:uncharacterized protein (TIGR03435 family)